jgi:hypothetical protein
MSFCENIGEQVEIKGVNSNRKVFICEKCVGTTGTTTDGQQVNYCPFSSIIAARSCKGFQEHTEGGMETVAVEWIEYS